MHDDVIPPAPGFPRTLLVAPGLVPVFILGFAGMAHAAGHAWNVHGDLLVIVGLAMLASLAGLVVECVALPLAIRRLVATPSLRTPLNLACTALGALFVVGALVAFASLK